MNPIKDIVFDDYDVSNGSKNVVIDPERDHVWSLQLIWKNLTGSLTGTFAVEASNDGENFHSYGSGFTTTLNSASGSELVSDSKLPFSYLRFNFTVGGITGGTIKAILVMKPKKESY
jgi:hypothetical protein